VEVEASSPGGFPAWKKFLEKNLDANASLKALPRKTKYFEQTAICQFIVCKDGTICDIRVVNKGFAFHKKRSGTRHETFRQLGTCRARRQKSISLSQAAGHFCCHVRIAISDQNHCSHSRLSFFSVLSKAILQC
jgi:hypothetical protein